ncbi:hypothetical protein ACFWF9_21210 [Streptomyces roseolus]|uniref:hypothetical protein n=1 Tax=Streptomyces roseolus TaxID=67358 RepID=UPI003658963D
MGRLASTVHVYDPERRERVILLPGDEPSPEVARRITTPAAWEGGVLPDEKPVEPEAEAGPGPEPDLERAAEPEPEGGPEFEPEAEPEAEGEPEPEAKKTAPRRTSRKTEA